MFEQTRKGLKPVSGDDFGFKIMYIEWETELRGSIPTMCGDSNPESKPEQM